MKKIIFLILTFTIFAVVPVFAHEIIAGHTYEYEWTIINYATGEVISSGNGTVVPTTGKGYRSIEHYIRSAVLGWKSQTRTIGGVRQKIIINLAGEESCS